MRQHVRDSLKVYLVMGLKGCGGLSAYDIAEAALDGGVTMLQLREKNAPLPQVLEEGRRLRELCRRRGIPFLVNDRVDVALLLDADGVHVGQDDIPGSDARRLLGPDKIVGISAGTTAEANAALAAEPDYLGIGPIYATSTKEDAGAPIGTGLIREVSALRPDMPLVGIGGITASNAAAVIAAGGAGVAVVSAITKQPDPAAAAKELLARVTAAEQS